MCLAPSFLPSRGGAVTRIPESKRRRTRSDRIGSLRESRPFHIASALARYLALSLSGRVCVPRKNFKCVRGRLKLSDGARPTAARPVSQCRPGEGRGVRRARAASGEPAPDPALRNRAPPAHTESALPSDNLRGVRAVRQERPTRTTRYAKTIPSIYDNSVLALPGLRQDRCCASRARATSARAPSRQSNPARLLQVS